MSPTKHGRIEKAPKTVCFEKGIDLLPVAASVTLEIARTDILQEKFKSQYIGCQPDHALLFKMPVTSIAKHPELLEKSNIMTVRGLSTQGEGAILAFRCTILRHYTPPFAMLATSLPDKIQVHLLRNEPRFNLDLHATIKMDKKVYQGGLADISISGCCFYTDTMPSIEIADEVVLEVSQGSDDKLYEFAGVVRNKRKVNSVFMVGVSFDSKVLPVVESMLQAFIIRGSIF